MLYQKPGYVFLHVQAELALGAEIGFGYDRTRNGHRGYRMDEIQEDGSRLLMAVQAISISPKNAKAMANKYQARSLKQNRQLSELEVKHIAAKRIVDRYAKLAATSGGATALTGIIPGLGTAVAMLGGRRNYRD